MYIQEESLQGVMRDLRACVRVACAALRTENWEVFSLNLQRRYFTFNYAPIKMEQSL